MGYSVMGFYFQKVINLGKQVVPFAVAGPLNNLDTGYYKNVVLLYRGVFRVVLRSRKFRRKGRRSMAYAKREHGKR